MRPRRSRLRSIENVFFKNMSLKVTVRPMSICRSVTRDRSMYLEPLSIAEKIIKDPYHTRQLTYAHLGEKMFGDMVRTMKFSTVSSQNVFQPTMRLFKRYGYGLERLDFQSINLVELDQVTDYLRDYLVASEGMKYLSKTRLFYRLSPIWRYENPMIHRLMRGFM